MKELKKELKTKNIIWVTPENDAIFASGQLEQIFDLLANIARENKTEVFNMMPKLINIRLITGEVVEGVATANFNNGNVEVLGIFLYDYTKNSYEGVKAILQKHFAVTC